MSKDRQIRGTRWSIGDLARSLSMSAMFALLIGCGERLLNPIGRVAPSAVAFFLIMLLCAIAVWLHRRQLGAFVFASYYVHVAALWGCNALGWTIAAGWFSWMTGIIALVGALICGIGGTFLLDALRRGITLTDRIGAICPACGYSLLGLTEHRCPECGRSFTLEELGITAEELKAPAALRDEPASSK